ncbi:MAG TPA: hypothetical protein VIJ00_07530 [Nakamurella sp.]
MTTPIATGGGSEVTVGFVEAPPTLTIHCGPLVSTTGSVLSPRTWVAAAPSQA